MKFLNDVRLFLFLATAALLISTPRLHADMVIDFQKGDDLKAVFDGGMRPWRVQGLERSHLEFGSADVKIVLPTGETFSLPTDRGALQVIARNKLTSFDLVGKEISLGAGVTLAKALCNSLSISTAGLDQLVREPGTIKDPSKYWSSQDNNKGKISVQIVLHPVIHLDTPTTAYVSVSLGWNRPLSEGGILPGPVQPPSGYEGVSMEPPKPDPNAKPNPGPEYYRDLATQAKLKNSQPTPVPTEAPAASSSAPPGAVSPAPVIERKSPLWPWVAGIVALTVIAFLVLKRRR